MLPAWFASQHSRSKICAQELKTTRAKTKRALTKEENEDELDNLSDKLANLKTLFKSLTATHEAYHGKIIGEDDIDISET